MLNGLNGMQRDVLLRLFHLLWDKSEKIQAIIGMCEEHMDWRTHSYFLKHRPRKIPASFCSTGGYAFRGGYSVTDTKNPRILRCSFTSEEWRTVFLDPVIDSESSFRWKVKIKYEKDANGSGIIGALRLIDRDLLNFFFIGNDKESWGFFFSHGRSPMLMGVHGIVCTSRNPVSDGSLVTIDAGGKYHALFFTVNGKKVPHAVTRVRYPIRFGVSSSMSISLHICHLRPELLLYYLCIL